MNSAGSATKENEKVIESISGKISNFKSQFEELSQNLISSRFVKTIVDIGTAFLKLANTDLGQLAIKLGITVTAIGLFNAGLNKLKKTSASISLVGLLTYIRVLGTDAATSTFSVNALTASLAKMAATKLVAMAEDPLTWVVAGTAAVYGLAKAFNAVNVSSTEYYNNAIKKYEESNQKLDETKNKVTEIETNIKELRSKGSLRTSIEEATLTKYKEQLKELQAQQTELEKQTKERKKQLEIAAKEQAQKKITGFKGTTVGIEETKGEISKDAYSGLLTTNKDKGTQTFGYRTEKITNYKQALSLIKSINTELKQGNLSEEEKNKKIQQQQSLKKALIDYENQYLEASKQENLSSKDKNEYLKKYVEIQKEVDPDKWAKSVLTDMFKNDDIILATNNTKTFNDALREMQSDGELTAEEITNLREQFPEFNKYLNENGMSTEQAAYYLKNYSEALQQTASDTISATDILTSYSSQLDGLKSQYDLLNAAIDEYNESGYITADTMSKLIDNNLLEYLTLENGQMVANTSALQALAEQYKAEASQKLASAMASEMMDVANEKVCRTVATTGGAVANLGAEAITAGQNATEGAKGFITFAAAAEKARAAAQGGATGSAVAGLFSESQESEISAIEKKYAAYWKQIEGSFQIKNKATGTGAGTGKGKKSGSSSKSEKAWWEKELESIKDQYENNDITIEQYINSLDNLLGRVQQGTDAWEKINKELQKQKLQKVEDDYKRGTISLKEYIKQLQNLQKAYKEGTDGWLNLADKIKKGLQDLLNEQKSAYDKAHNAANQIIEDEIDKINDQKEATSDYYDKLIEEKQKANDESERELELAKLQEALEKAKKERTKKVFVEGLGWRWETDKSAIDEAQKDLDDFMNEQEIKDLEDAKDKALAVFEEQLKAWNKYKESWSDVVNDYENEQARLTLQQTLGADAEAKILQQRLDVLEKFKNEYNATLSQIDALEKTSSTNTGALNNYYNNARSFAGGVNNGVVDYTGYARVHGTSANPEYVLNNRQMRNLLRTFTSPRYNKVAMAGGGQVNNYNFGDLNLPNVSNASQFITELKSIVNITKHQ